MDHARVIGHHSSDHGLSWCAEAVHSDFYQPTPCRTSSQSTCASTGQCSIDYPPSTDATMVVANGLRQDECRYLYARILARTGYDLCAECWRHHVDPGKERCVCLRAGWIAAAAEWAA